VDSEANLRQAVSTSGTAVPIHCKTRHSRRGPGLGWQRCQHPVATLPHLTMNKCEKQGKNEK
jgi:hypothetical protein